MEVFSARLKWLRERNKLSQQKIADMLGLSQSYYGRFERDKGEPNLETLVKLPSILGEDIRFILGMTDFDSVASSLLQKIKETIVEIEYFSGKQSFYVNDATFKDSVGTEKFFSIISDLQSNIEKRTPELEIRRSDLLDHLKQVPNVKDRSLLYIHDLKPKDPS